MIGGIPMFQFWAGSSEFTSKSARGCLLGPAGDSARFGNERRESGGVRGLRARLSWERDSPTARQPDSPTARQPDSPTARQPDSPTARQPDSPTARQLGKRGGGSCRSRRTRSSTATGWQPDSPTARQPDNLSALPRRTGWHPATDRATRTPAARDPASRRPSDCGWAVAVLPSCGGGAIDNHLVCHPDHASPWRRELAWLRQCRA